MKKNNINENLTFQCGLAYVYLINFLIISFKIIILNKNYLKKETLTPLNVFLL